MAKLSKRVQALRAKVEEHLAVAPARVVLDVQPRPRRGGSSSSQSRTARRAEARLPRSTRSSLSRGRLLQAVPALGRQAILIHIFRTSFPIAVRKKELKLESARHPLRTESVNIQI